MNQTEAVFNFKDGRGTRSLEVNIKNSLTPWVKSKNYSRRQSKYYTRGVMFVTDKYYHEIRVNNTLRFFCGCKVDLAGFFQCTKD